nr:hypothetical protein TetV2_00380 [Oceanusvirus sp.]
METNTLEATQSGGRAFQRNFTIKNPSLQTVDILSEKDEQVAEAVEAVEAAEDDEAVEAAEDYDEAVEAAEDDEAVEAAEDYDEAVEAAEDDEAVEAAEDYDEADDIPTISLSEILDEYLDRLVESGDILDIDVAQAMKDFSTILENRKEDDIVYDLDLLLDYDLVRSAIEANVLVFHGGDGDGDIEDDIEDYDDIEDIEDYDDIEDIEDYDDIEDDGDIEEKTTKGGGGQNEIMNLFRQFKGAVNDVIVSKPNGSVDNVMTTMHALVNAKLPTHGSVSTDMKYCRYILRFFVGVFATLAAVATGAAFVVGPMSLVGAAMFGALGFGCGLALRILGGQNAAKGKKFKKKSLIDLLRRDEDVRTASGLLLSSISKKTDDRHRIYTACFLYFISQLDEQKLKTYLGSDIVYSSLKLLYPVMRKKRDTYKISESITATTLRILETYAQGTLPSAPNENARYSTVFPPLPLFWYELVPGMLLRALFYCQQRISRTPLKDVLNSIPEWSLESFSRAIAVNADTVCAGGAENSAKIEEFYNRKEFAYKRRNPANSDHALFVTKYHGSIIDGADNVSIPDNVTMVIPGIAGKGLCMHISDPVSECNKNFHDLTSDAVNYGSDVVPPNAVYPNIRLSAGITTGSSWLYRCDTKEELQTRFLLDITSVTLRDILETVSDSARKSGHMALLIFRACQDSESALKKSAGTETAYQAIHRLNSSISVLSIDGKRRKFSVLDTMYKSWTKRRDNPENLDIPPERITNVLKEILAAMPKKTKSKIDEREKLHQRVDRIMSERKARQAAKKEADEERVRFDQMMKKTRKAAALRLAQSPPPSHVRRVQPSHVRRVPPPSHVRRVPPSTNVRRVQPQASRGWQIPNQEQGQGRRYHPQGRGERSKRVWGGSRDAFSWGAVSAGLAVCLASALLPR